MAFELPPLPYADDALEPVYSAKTIGFHYGKHHKTYVDTLNKLTEGTDLAGKPLEDVIKGAGDPGPLFNNAAQVWNHTFFWNGMKPGGGGAPSGAVADMIDAAFGEPREVRRGLQGGRRGPLRQRLGLARGRGRRAQDRQHAQRRDAAHHGARRRC